MKIVISVLTLSFALPGTLVEAQQPSNAQISAVKSACRGDYMNVCSSVPTGTQKSLQCLQDHSQQVSPGCQSALAALSAPAPAASSSAAAPSSSSAPSASAPSTPAASPAPQMTPRAQARLLRTDCSSDFQKFCSGTPFGGGRAMACLKDHASDLSALCRSALMATSQR
jgi:Cysteine rich repeat